MAPIVQQQPMMPQPMANPLKEQLKKIQNEELLPATCTVYCQNLSEKVKLVELKNSLFQLFSHYGEVHEVHAKKNVRSRGQAYVVMNNTKTAE